MNQKEPTCVSLVEEALKRADDFVTARALVQLTGLNINQVSASLYSLKKYKVVDVVDNKDGLWWFYTPESDTRLKHVEMRIKEDKPRRKRSVLSKVQNVILSRS